jgi:hypothetical protein
MMDDTQIIYGLNPIDPDVVVSVEDKSYYFSKSFLLGEVAFVNTSLKKCGFYSEPYDPKIKIVDGTLKLNVAKFKELYLQKRKIFDSFPQTLQQKIIAKLDAFQVF